MKMIPKIKKYDLVTLHLEENVIQNCLIYEINDHGIKVYPIQRLVEETDFPRAVARVFVHYPKIKSIEHENINLLFYAIHTHNTFVQEALEFHMKRISEEKYRKD